LPRLRPYHFPQFLPHRLATLNRSNTATIAATTGIIAVIGGTIADTTAGMTVTTTGIVDRMQVR
jgi:hypothetical protein